MDAVYKKLKKPILVLIYPLKECFIHNNKGKIYVDLTVEKTKIDKIKDTYVNNVLVRHT